MKVERLKELIDNLNDAFKFGHGSLFNDLHQITDESYLKTNGYVDRSKDTVLQAVFLNITALIMAEKTKAIVASQLASRLAPPDGVSCADLNADKEFQLYQGMMLDAIENIERLIAGVTPEKKAPFTFDSAVAPPCQ